ncbi:hypothetical protein ABZZ74_35655 [Streptomyces sp. NPDC006476]|uniref:hypothetical protein n=1 Tax=Streptomyces sp. NPDC006476 TaxID=3157175 RepID=UPI0033ADC0F7
MRPRRSLRVSLLALLTSGVTLFAAATATADTPYKDPLQAVSSSGFGLTWHPVTPATTANLDSKLNNVGVTEVLNSANHSTRSCDAAEAETLPTQPTASTSFCWDTGDATTEDWHPQSITSSGDADDDGAWGTNKLLLSAWSYVGPTDESTGHLHNTVRVAFIDYNNPSAPKYRWVLLVTPTSGGENYHAVQAHAGGIAWYGDKLFVSGQEGSNNGLYVFSMSHILQASVNGTTVGKVDGGYSAWGYQYVMPAIGSYGYDTTCTGGQNTGTPCFDSISLDRSSVPNSLVTAEYLNNGTKARLVRYDFGSDYLLGNSSAGGAGTEVGAHEAFQSGVGNIQGVLAHNRTWYVVHASNTSGVHGHLWGQTTSSSTPTCGGTYQCWAEHGEALSLWWNTGQVWSLTEWPGLRTVFAVPLSSLP